MAAILFLKLGQVTIMLTFLAIYLLCKCNEPRFQVLEHFNDFEIIDYGGHFVFQIEAKIVFSQNIWRAGLPMGCFYILKS